MFMTHRWHQPYLVFIHDLAWVPITVLLAFYLRFNFDPIPASYLHAAYVLIGFSLPIQAGMLYAFRVYRSMWHYVSLVDLMRILKSVLIGVMITLLLAFFVFRLQNIPRSFVLLYPLLLIVALSAPRLIYRLFKDHRLVVETGVKRKVLLIGAGRAGELLLRDMLKSRAFVPIGILDDDASKQSQELHGTAVIGTIGELESVVLRYAPDLVMLAIPSAPSSIRNYVMLVCNQQHVQLQVLPTINQLLSNVVYLRTLREVGIEDILGRDAVQADAHLLASCITNKVVLVTGAGGSIGSELCRQILKQHPTTLVLFERNEFALYQIDAELRSLRQEYSDLTCDVIPILGSVCNESRLERVCNHFGVHTLYHAAAYKHVPLVEFNPTEAVRNNTLGTMHAAQAAMNSGVRNFVLISTDKAVRPTNVMGATKRFAEMVLQALSQVHDSSKTCFSMVRFGNVLGSSGSVVPLFRKQIECGGPITVTDPEITRYFMSIPEAAQLVIQAGAMAEGGDVFILDMGQPVKIVDLARQMIQLSGLTVQDDEHPHGDIAITFSGLRPGEKLYEELLISDAVLGTQHPLIMRGKDDCLSWDALQVYIERLTLAIDHYDVEDIRQCLLTVVHGYAPQCGINDLLVPKK